MQIGKGGSEILGFAGALCVGIVFVSWHNIDCIVAEGPHIESAVSGEVVGLGGVIWGRIRLPIMHSATVFSADQGADSEPPIGTRWVDVSFRRRQFSHFISWDDVGDSLTSSLSPDSYGMVYVWGI